MPCTHTLVISNKNYNNLLIFLLIFHQHQRHQLTEHRRYIQTPMPVSHCHICIYLCVCVHTYEGLRHHYIVNSTRSSFCQICAKTTTTKEAVLCICATVLILNKPNWHLHMTRCEWLEITSIVGPQTIESKTVENFIRSTSKRVLDRWQKVFCVLQILYPLYQSVIIFRVRSEFGLKAPFDFE